MFESVILFKFWNLLKAMTRFSVRINGEGNTYLVKEREPSVYERGCKDKKLR